MLYSWSFLYSFSRGFPVRRIRTVQPTRSRPAPRPVQIVWRIPKRPGACKAPSPHLGRRRPLPLWSNCPRPFRSSRQSVQRQPAKGASPPRPRPPSSRSRHRPRRSFSSWWPIRLAKCSPSTERACFASPPARLLPSRTCPFRRIT